ncbi:lamin-like protein [Morus notabilis]|uniref:lamin-like protein n=1 Tax=Morus notabilis TaxID=981085 RepID=UPI000CED5086|nr:lamin-like protein [Morus notabilis]
MDGLIMSRRTGRLAMVVIWVMMSLVGLKTSVMAKTTLHRVGGSLGWNQNINYTLWSASQHIYVGDWLYFHFDKRYYNVLEVNKTSYENCDDQSFIKNITQGGRDVYELTEARPYYFLSGGGYCYHGMRVAIFVDDRLLPATDPAPSPAPVPAQNASPMSNNSTVDQMFLYIVLLSITFILFILF